MILAGWPTLVILSRALRPRTYATRAESIGPSAGKKRAPQDDKRKTYPKKLDAEVTRLASQDLREKIRVPR